MILLLVGLALMLLCLALQALAAAVGIRWFARVNARPLDRHALWRSFYRVAGVMLAIALGIIAQIMVWAMLYSGAGVLPDFGTALYFSGVTFTSLGYGDVVLTGPVRLLAPVEAMTGLLMFAIATAVLIAVIQRLVNRDRP